MKTRFIVFPIALMALLGMMLSSCTDLANKFVNKMLNNFEYEDSEDWGKVITKNLDLADFSSLDVNGVVRIVWTQDSLCSVKLEGNEKCMEEYVCQVRDGELKIKTADGSTSFNGSSPRLTVYLTSPLLKDADLHGACRLEMPGCSTMSTELDIDIAGACYIGIDTLEVQELNIEVNGAGCINMAKVSVTRDIEVEMNGAAALNANVKCSKLSVELNGASNAILGGECERLVLEENGSSKSDISKLKR